MSNWTCIHMSRTKSQTHKKKIENAKKLKNKHIEELTLDIR